MAVKTVPVAVDDLKFIVATLEIDQSVRRWQPNCYGSRLIEQLKQKIKEA